MVGHAKTNKQTKCRSWGFGLQVMLVKGHWAQALLNLSHGPSFPQIRQTVLLSLSCRCDDKGLSPCSGSDPCALVHAGTMGRLLTTACG
jgi:hypothetical protein